MLLLLFALVSVGSLAACAVNRQSSCSNCYVNSYDSSIRNGLPLVDYASRPLIELWDGTQVEGSLVTLTEITGNVRDLSFAECQRIAGLSSPAARQLEYHRAWLLKNDSSQEAIAIALCHQARFERGVHVARALEAYLNKTDIHAQRTILNQIQAVIQDSESAITKFRQAGVDVPGDTNELSQRRLELQQQLSTLSLTHSRLDDVIEMLLELQHQPDLPIWTSFVSPRRDNEPTELEAVAVALAHRGDLLALEHLEGNSDNVSPDMAKSLVAASNPLMSVSVSIPGQAKWWQCIKRRKIERLKDLEKCERKRQLHAIVEVKRELIRQEVFEVLQSLRHHRELLDIKQERLMGISASLESEAKAKNEHPLELKSRLVKEVEQLKLTSEMIHELIAIDIEFVRLDRILGVPHVFQ